MTRREEEGTPVVEKTFLIHVTWSLLEFSGLSGLITMFIY